MIAIQIPKTQYSTVNYARMLSVDMPFAQHNRGTPFNEKNGPAIALVGAYSAISAGAAMFATATLSGMIMGGMMIAGGVMSGLGAITGNETLSNIGGALSLAGGVGSAFFDSATGAFANPFTEGNFANSLSAKGAEGVKKAFGFGGSGAEDAATKYANTGEEVLAGATDSIDAQKLAGGADGNFILNDVADGASSASSSVSSAATSAAGDKGLLSSIGGNKDLLNLASGASDAYMKNKEIEAGAPLRDAQLNNYNANANATNAGVALQQQRSSNMLAQPSVEIGVNPNANIFTNQPTQQGKYAVAMNGEVKYLTQAEYDAVRQSQGGAGLLSQGATA